MGLGAIPCPPPRSRKPPPWDSWPQSKERHPAAGSERGFFGGGGMSLVLSLLKGRGLRDRTHPGWPLMGRAPPRRAAGKLTWGGAAPMGRRAGAVGAGGEASCQRGIPGTGSWSSPYVSLSCEKTPPTTTTPPTPTHTHPHPPPPPHAAAPARHERGGAVLRLGSALQGVVRFSESPNAGF